LTVNINKFKNVFLSICQTAEADLSLWRDLNTSRNILSILGWFVISLTPLADRLTENLRQTDEEDLLGVDVDTKASIA